MISFNLNLDALTKEAEQIEQTAHQAARPAAQAGAQVLYNQVKANVAALGTVTGNLNSSIYQVFSADQSTDDKKVYHVSWNAREAPHGHLVEFGYIKRHPSYVGSDGNWYTNKKVNLPSPVQVPGQAFVRRAESAVPAAEAAMRARFEEEMSKK